MTRISRRVPNDIRKYANREAELREFIYQRLEQKYSVGQIKAMLEEVGVVVCRRTIYNWCAKWQKEVQ